MHKTIKTTFMISKMEIIKKIQKNLITNKILN